MCFRSITSYNNDFDSTTGIQMQLINQRLRIRSVYGSKDCYLHPLVQIIYLVSWEFKSALNSTTKYNMTEEYLSRQLKPGYSGLVVEFVPHCLYLSFAYRSQTRTKSSQIRWHRNSRWILFISISLLAKQLPLGRGRPLPRVGVIESYKGLKTTFAKSKVKESGKRSADFSSLATTEKSVAKPDLW